MNFKSSEYLHYTIIIELGFVRVKFPKPPAKTALYYFCVVSNPSFCRRGFSTRKLRKRTLYYGRYCLIIRLCPRIFGHKKSSVSLFRWTLFILRLFCERENNKVELVVCVYVCICWRIFLELYLEFWFFSSWLMFSGWFKFFNQQILDIFSII